MKAMLLFIFASLVIFVFWNLTIFSPVFSESRKLPGWLKETPITHRGMHGKNAPENTLAAFKYSIKHGFGIELDTHLTKDGEVVILHDESLQRMCGVEGNVHDKTCAELAKLKVDGTNEGIPLLRDVLKLVDGQVPLFIELKTIPGQEGPLEQSVYNLVKDYKGPLAVISFNPKSLEWFRDHAPEILRGQTACALDTPKHKEQLSWVRRFLWRHYLCNTLSRPDFLINKLPDLPNPTLSYLRSMGKPVIVWGVETMQDVPIAREKASNFMFDHIGKKL